MSTALSFRSRNVISEFSVSFKRELTTQNAIYSLYLSENGASRLKYITV